MPDINTVPVSLAANWWSMWLLSAVLVVAAVIDGWKLRVPNWITFPLIIGGWVYSAVVLWLGGACLESARNDRRAGIAVARLRDRRHGGRRRQAAGRNRRLGVERRHTLCVLRLRSGRRRSSPWAWSCGDATGIITFTSFGASPTRFLRFVIPTRCPPLPPSGRVPCCCCLTGSRLPLERSPILFGQWCHYEITQSTDNMRTRHGRSAGSAATPGTRP